MLCCRGKSSSYIHTSKLNRSCSYGQISLKTPSFEKEHPIANIYIFKTFPTGHFDCLKSLFMPYCASDCVERKERTRCINILKMNIYYY